MNSIELAIVLSGQKLPKVTTNVPRQKLGTLPTNEVNHWEYPTGFRDFNERIKKIARIEKTYPSQSKITYPLSTAGRWGE